MQLIKERVSGRIDGEFVVFLIGMRINRWWKPWVWLRVGAAMGRMLRELGMHPELGFLNNETGVGRTIVMVQHWRSMEHLLAYAKKRDAEHLPAWRAFNKLVGTNGDVGIWHETYRVRPGDYESVYVNMPPFGLGRAGELVPAHGKREGAAGRLAEGAIASEKSDAPHPA
jgi:hypothetical protein